MAIISAGVIMNVLFAVLMASWAFGLGVREMTCAVSSVRPGGAAWRAGLRTGPRRWPQPSWTRYSGQRLSHSGVRTRALFRRAG